MRDWNKSYDLSGGSDWRTNRHLSQALVAPAQRGFHSVCFGRSASLSYTGTIRNLGLLKVIFSEFQLKKPCLEDSEFRIFRCL